MEILPWTPLQVLLHTTSFHALVCTHFFHEQHLSILKNYFFFHISILLLSFPQNTKYSSSPLVPPPRPLLELASLSNGSWKSFPLINVPLILHEPMRIENDFSLQWKRGWESLCPMKHEESSIFQSNRMIILMTNGIGTLILFLILDILVGFLSSIMINFLHSTLTSYFFILIILSN